MCTIVAFSNADYVNKTFNVPVDPILINAPELDKDPLLKNHKDDLCPGGKKKALGTSKNLIEQTIFQGKDVFEKFSKELKTKFKIAHELDHKMIKMIGDVAISDYFHRPDSPILDLKDPLGNYVQNINTLHHLAVSLDKTFIKVVVTNLVKEITKVLSNKATKPNSHKEKFVLYSMHDTNMSPLLMHLGIPDFNCNLKQILTHEIQDCVHKPPYAANVIFELGVNKQGEFAVFFRYNGEYRDICSGKFPPPIDKVPCPLDRLVDRLKGVHAEHPTELYDFCGIELVPVVTQKNLEKKDESVPVQEKKSDSNEFARERPSSGFFTRADTILLCISIFILSAMVFKYKSDSNERLRMIRKLVAELKEKTAKKED